MDAHARQAFMDLTREAVAADLDQLAAEVDRLRKQVAVLERQTGLASGRLPRSERRAQVAELRAQGLSARMIAQRVGTHRVTVMHDLRELGAPTPATTIGVDGVERRRRHPAPGTG